MLFVKVILTQINIFRKSNSYQSNFHRRTNTMPEDVYTTCLDVMYGSQYKLIILEKEKKERVTDENIERVS